MPKQPNNTVPKRNPSEEKLRATPFDSVAEMEAEAKAIRLAVWRRYAEAQIINELLTKPEMKFILEQWEAGLIAFYGSNGKDQVFRVYSEGKGLRLELNKIVTQSIEGGESSMLAGMVKAGIEGFGQLYYRGRCLIGDTVIKPQESATTDKDIKATKSGKKSKKPRG